MGELFRSCLNWRLSLDLIFYLYKISNLRDFFHNFSILDNGIVVKKIRRQKLEFFGDLESFTEIGIFLGDLESFRRFRILQKLDFLGVSEF